jgi:hypothetical protein
MKPTDMPAAVWVLLLTNRSNCGSRKDSSHICGEKNLIRLATRNHSHAEWLRNIGQQKERLLYANWLFYIIKVMTGNEALKIL